MAQSKPKPFTLDLSETQFLHLENGYILPRVDHGKEENDVTKCRSHGENLAYGNSLFF